MGYDQFVELHISKEGVNGDTFLIALGLAFPEFHKYLSKAGIERGKDNKEEIRWYYNGSLFYDDNVLDERFNLQEISKELGCKIELYYEGEEKMDGEQKVWINGKLIEYRMLGWIDMIKKSESSE